MNNFRIFLDSLVFRELNDQFFFGNLLSPLIIILYIYIYIYIYIYFFFFLFMAVLGPRFCARAFSNCDKRGPLLIAVRGPLTVAEHRLSNCGSWAQSLRGTWDPPRPGLEPLSPALAGRLSTTAPPGKPYFIF